MAGGYHTYTAGQVPTAAELDSYVRDQVVSQFASTTARDAAITSPVEGMVCAITGDDRVYVYDGSAWQRPQLVHVERPPRLPRRPIKHDSDDRFRRAVGRGDVRYRRV